MKPVENKAEPQELNTNLSLDVIKAQINTSLIKEGWESFTKEVAETPFTEENLPKLREIKERFKKMYGAIETAHEKGKRPYLDVTQRYDAAKRELNDMVKLSFNPFKAGFDKLCRDIEENNRLLQKELERKQGIQKGIDNNVIFFSERIAKAETIKDLEELRIVVDTNKKDEAKYQEFLPQAQAAFDKILVMLDAQVNHLKQIEKLNQKLSKKTTDVHKRLSLEEQQQNLKDQVEENRIIVQEEAVNITMTNDVVLAQPEQTAIKPKRTTWKWDVYNWDEMERAGLTMRVVDEPKMREYVKLQKASLEGQDKEEVIMDGVRFYLHKEY